MNDDPTTAEPPEVWADGDGCLLTPSPFSNHWLAFGNNVPMPLASLTGTNRPAIRLFDRGGRYVGPDRLPYKFRHA